MCKAWDDHKESGRMEGRMEGRKEGRMEGRMEGLAEGRIEGAVLFARKLNMDDELIVKSIMEEFGITKDKAEEYVLTTV